VALSDYSYWSMTDEESISGASQITGKLQGTREVCCCESQRSFVVVTKLW